MNNTNYNWNYPTTIWVGQNRIKDLSLACKKLNISKPLFVTDRELVKSNIVKKTLLDLKKENLSFETFSNVSGNPCGSHVEEGVNFFNQKECDGVIAFGGGSGLDVGKAIAFMSGQNLPIWDFEDIGDNWTRANNDKISPIIAVPTTAGTGSETGRASVILDETTGIKKIIFHPKFLPSIVILDPILTIDLPSNITAATGMDALAHNLEAYCAPGYHPMADGIALEGMRLIKKSFNTMGGNLDITEKLQNYINDFGLKLNPIQQEIIDYNKTLGDIKRMQVDPTQCHFLHLIIKISNIKNVLEIGTFTGLSALTISLALPEDGKLIALDKNDETNKIALSFFKKARQEHKIETIIKPALETLEELKNKKFDMIFIDADKMNYKQYYEKSLGLIDQGGLIIIDNVLWHGEVADEKKNDKFTLNIREFNEFVSNDKRVEQVIIPLGDGMTVCRVL